MLRLYLPIKLCVKTTQNRRKDDPARIDAIRKLTGLSSPKQLTIRKDIQGKEIVELVHAMDRLIWEASSLDTTSIRVSSGSFLSPFSLSSSRPKFGLTNRLEGRLAFLAFSVGCSRRFLTDWYSSRFAGKLNRHLLDTVQPGGVCSPSSQSRYGTQKFK